MCSLRVSETAEWALNTRYRIVPCVAACAVLEIVGVECNPFGTALVWFSAVLGKGISRDLKVYLL